MPRSFEEIERAKAVQAIADVQKPREEIVAEQDARNEEARAQLDAEYEAVFGGAEAAPGAQTYDASGVAEAGQEVRKSAAKKSGRKR
jgi:hypothetical protein